jgi:hypothetical protein
MAAPRARTLVLYYAPERADAPRTTNASPAPPFTIAHDPAGMHVVRIAPVDLRDDTAPRPAKACWGCEKMRASQFEHECCDYGKPRWASTTGRDADLYLH